MRRPLAILLALAAALVLAAPAAAVNPWLGLRIINFAHQGGEDILPSNTLYAMKRSMAEGADMLELDIGVTKDDRIVVLHDNGVDRTTNGTGSVNALTLAQVRRLDAAYWFVPGRNAVKGLPASRYPYRGIRTGAKAVPKGFRREDFRVPTLDEVLAAFPRTPMNVEIKGVDGKDLAVYAHGAELLAALLKKSGRTDVIVTSFEQSAIDRFHELAPKVPLAPGIGGTASFFLSNGSPGPGVVAFQVPITYKLGDQLLVITTPNFVQRAHDAGYAVHVWLSNDTEDVATYKRLLNMCVDGIMAANPRSFEAVLRKAGIAQPSRAGSDPCGTRPSAKKLTAKGGAVSVPLARHGLSLEHRRGTVRLLARSGPARRVLGSGTFDLATGAAATTSAVRLNAAGRAALRSDPSLKVIAAVRERAPVSDTGVTLTAGEKVFESRSSSEASGSGR